MGKKIRQIGIRVEDEVHEEFRMLCDRFDLSMSKVTRGAIISAMDYLKSADSVTLPFVCVSKQKYDELLKAAGKKAKK
jgi:antitoxin component of RelBE/YafQ-DinJ toxin-antitoxin module